MCSNSRPKESMAGAASSIQVWKQDRRHDTAVEASEESKMRRNSAAQSQSRRLNTTYRLTQTTAISRIANGYPKTQCSSGICVKFMP